MRKIISRNFVNTVSSLKRTTETQVWEPKVPEVVSLSNGALVTEHGVEKSAFEAFFEKMETPSYCGYKWELVNNNVVIFDIANTPHEKAAGAFDFVLIRELILGGWEDDLLLSRSSKFVNPDPKCSNWQPDSSFVPNQRRGVMGSFDELSPYPTMVLEIASSETETHVIDKAREYLGPKTDIQIVIVLLIRPDERGADRLQALKFERGPGQYMPCWKCSFADPVCTQAGDPMFRLQIPVNLLFDNAPIPAALAGRTNVELDLFLWTKRLVY